MATRRDVLQIKLEVQGDGTVKASLAEVGKQAETTGKQVQGAAGGMRMLGEAIAAFGVAKVVQGFITVNREAEQLRVSLKTLEGSQSTATERFRELQDMARTTPLSVNQVTEAYIKLKNFGLEPMDGTMQAIIDTGAALGGGFETINGLIMAFGQANAKGKLQGEEMLQMAERGVPVYDTLARALGKTTGEIQEMASKGQLGRDTIKLLADELGKANFGAAAAQADTLDGAIGALLDNIEQLAIALGDSGLRQVLTILITQVGEGVQALTDMIGPVQDVGSEASAASKLMQGLSTAVLVVTSGAKVAGAGVGVFVDYLLALVDAAKAAMTAVTGYYTAVWQVMQGDFSGARDTVAQSLESSASAFERAKDRVANAHQTFGEVYNDIAQQLGDDLDKLKAAASGAADEVGKAGKAAAAAATPTAVLSDAVKKARTEAERLIAALEREIAAHGKTEDQILRETVERLRAAGATNEQADALMRLADERKRLKDEEEAQARRLAEQTRLVEDATRAGEAFAQLIREQAVQLGGPAVAAAQKYADELAIIAERERTLLDLGPASIAQQQELADARKQAAANYARESAEAMERAALDSLNSYGRVMMQGFQDLGPALTDGLMSGEWDDVGKRLGESILGGVLDAFMDQAIVKPIQNAFLNMLSSSGQSGGGGFMSSIAGMFGTSSGGSIAGGGAGGMGGAATGVLASNPIGWIIAGMMMNNQLFSQGWQASTADKPAGSAWYGLGGLTPTPMTMMWSDQLLRSLGMSDRAASLITGSSILTRLFGRKAPEVTGSGITGSYGFDGFDGQSYADIYQRGGLFRSSRRWTEYGDMDAGVDATFDRMIAQLRRGVERLADSLGQDIGAALDAIRIDASLELSDDPEEAKRQIEAYVQNMLEELARAALDAMGYAKLPDLAGISAAEALTGLQDLTGYLDDLNNRMDQLSSDPIVQLRMALDDLARSEQDALLALEDAIAGFNPAEIAAAAAGAEAAIVARYNAEIEMVRSLETALLTAQQQARALDLQLAQRIAGLSGDWSGAADTARTGMITTQALVMGTTDPERALAFLDEFISHVEAWLQSSINQVNALAQAEQNRINTALAGIAAQQQALQAQMAVLLDERNSIIAEATARSQAAAQAAQAQAQAIAQAQQAAAQAQIEALQEQLDIAQQFARVMADAQAMIERMTFSSSNPLGAQARLALMDQEIAAAEAAMAGSTGADQAAAAARILDLLNQRLQLVQSEGLMQRPGEDYLALYNDTLQRIAGVQAIAEPEADLALQLQEELNRIQSRTFDAISSIGSTVTYTAAEQARLAAIAEEEARIQAEMERLEAEALELQAESIEIQRRAEEQIATLQREAQAQYEWARGEAARLQAERAQALQSQIDVITGGRPIDEFIAARQAESVGLLTNIRDDLRNFLGAISGNAASPGTGTMPGTGPGQGGTPKPPGDDHQQPLPNLPTVHMPTTLHITVASGDPQQIAAAVTTALDTQMPQIATRLKRELDTA